MFPPPEPLEAALSGADDRLRLSHWLPPQEGIVPRVRTGRRWVSVLRRFGVASRARTLGRLGAHRGLKVSELEII